MRGFLVSLRETGAVEVPPASEPVPPIDAAADDVLLEMDAVARLRAPANAPDLDLPAARWAARLLHRACQLLADRTADAATVARELAAGGPEPSTAPVVWSVDLALHWLPDLARLARGLAPADPLVTALQRLGSAWPLSSVGMTLDVRLRLPVCLCADPCLKTLYVDRVLSRGAIDRLAVPWVASAAAAAVGAHPSLAPAIAAATTTEAGGG